MTKSQKVLILATIGLAVTFPLLGNFLRRNRDAGCALDGQPIDPRTRVRIVDTNLQSHLFCCIVCADLWFEKRNELGHELGHAVFVIDETSGEEFGADAAFFVRSQVVTMRPTGNRVHVFRQQEAAENHARSFRGTLLRDRERPFVRWQAVPDRTK